MPTNILSYPTEINALLTIGGTDNVSVTSTGNVGIGTTSPAAKLHVDGNVRFVNSGFAGFEAHNTNGTWESFIGTETGGGGNRYNSASSQHTFYNNSTAVMRINSNGNVGIGTTSPYSKLTVRTESASHQIFSINRAASDTAALYMGNDASTHAIIAANNSDLRIGKDLSDTFYEYVRVKDGGNVGIGTASPVSTWLSGFDPSTGNGNFKLTSEGWIVTPYLTGLASYFSTQGARPIIWADASGTSIQSWDNSSTDGVSVKSSNGTTRLFVREDGNVGIANSDPDALLDVGVSMHQSATGADIAAGAGGANVIGLTSTLNHNWLPFTDGRNYLSAQAHTFRSADHTTDWMHIAPTGNVGIGTTSPGANLQIGSPGANLTQDLLLVKGGGSSGNYGFRVQANNSDELFLVDTLSYNTIISNGNVGIGTTSPAAKLHVVGDIRAGDGTADTATRSYFSDGTYTEMRGYGLQFNRGSSYIRPTHDKQKAMFFGADGRTWTQVSFNSQNYYFNEDTTAHVSIISGGNVGIGTTSPEANLHVNAADGGILRLSDTSASVAGDRIGAIQTATSAGTFFAGINFYYHDSSNGEIRIRQKVAGTNTNTATFVDGNVGIGTTSPSEKLEVNGNVKADNFIGGNAAGIYSFNDTVNASTSEDIFSISNLHGAQAFRVTFVCDTSSYSVAKTFEVVHAFGANPAFFKVVDTGPLGLHDFDVSFANSNSNTGITCSITNNSTTINANIVTTVFLGGSPTAITVTAL